MMTEGGGGGREGGIFVACDRRAESGERSIHDQLRALVVVVGCSIDDHPMLYRRAGAIFFFFPLPSFC